MLTWKKVHEWAGIPDSQRRYSWHYRGWYWTALLATYGKLLRTELLKAAAELAVQHREHPDYSIHRNESYCLCHMRPRLLESYNEATWDGDSSVAAWYHLPLVKAYMLALLASDEDAASSYLMEFGAQLGFWQAFDIARGIEDIPRTHSLARQIVDQYPQRVYFLCRETITDPELLERARQGLLADPNPLQAVYCAEATRDEEFLGRIRVERAAAALTG